MADLAFHEPLTGHAEFDNLIATFAEEPDPAKAEAMRQDIWDRYGTEGAVFIRCQTLAFAGACGEYSQPNARLLRITLSPAGKSSR